MKRNIIVVIGIIIWIGLGLMFYIGIYQYEWINTAIINALCMIGGLSISSTILIGLIIGTNHIRREDNDNI
jgi:Kef-type K+ transport system membrane component KefB